MRQICAFYGEGTVTDRTCQKGFANLNTKSCTLNGALQ